MKDLMLQSEKPDPSTYLNYTDLEEFIKDFESEQK